MTGPSEPTSQRPSRRPPVAFLDESYDYTRDGSREPLYVLAAVLIDGDEVDAARRRAQALVSPAVGYHTTELARAGKIDKVHAMLNHVRNDAGWSVVAIQSPYSGHAELARQRCLRQLLVDLSGRKVARAILDSRIQPRASDPRMLDKQDERTARELRSAGSISRHLSINHATDRVEPLLWLPDGVAWAVRRAMVADDDVHFEIIRSVTSLIVVDG